MIYSGSGSSFDFSEFQIQANFQIHVDPDTDPTMLVKWVYLEIVKKHLKFNHKEEFINYRYLFAIFIYLPFHILLNNNTGFGSRQKFRIHADPDPQPCIQGLYPHYR